MQRGREPRSHTMLMLMPERQEPRGVVFIVSLADLNEVSSD
jgi:hypothetical protein